MSAYSASAPVTARTTAPSTMNEAAPWLLRKPKAWTGFRAASTSGACAIPCMPLDASAMNHVSMIGPNSLPTAAVPLASNANSATSTTTAIGTTYGLKARVPTSRPSTADSTEIAGVSTASP